MGRGVVPQRVRGLALVGLVGLLVAGGAQAADAHRTELTVEVVSEQATLAPDGRSMTFHLVEEGGDFFPGFDLRTVQITQA